MLRRKLDRSHVILSPEDRLCLLRIGSEVDHDVKDKGAVKWTRLSCRDFKYNRVRLQLFALAYDLGNFLRRLALPRSLQHWSLTTLWEKLIKIGAKVVRHAKHVTFQLAKVAVPRDLFAAMLERIQWFGVPPPLADDG